MNSTASPVSEGDEPSKIAPANSAEFIDVDGYDDAFDNGKKKVRLSWSSWKLVLRRTWTDFFYQALGDRAAAMTYFTVMAFAPTVLALYSLATLLFASRRDEVLDLTTGFIEEYVPADLVPQGLELVSSIIGSTAEGTWALVISVLVSLFSASAYVRAFSRTGNLVYGRIEGRGMIRTWATMWGLTIFLVFGLVLVLFANLLRDTVITGVLEPLAQPLGLEGLLDFLLSIFLPIWAWVRFPLTVLLVLVLIAVLYHFAPNVRPIRFRWITPGAIFALTLSVAVWSLFGLYLRIYAGASAYGAVSTVMAVLLAVWIMNIILIIGIKIDAEILRAKELQVGLESERHIQVPPRDDSAAEAQVQKQLDLESDSRDLSLESRSDGDDIDASDKE
ncbi:YihY/virulence factor BrkB family protein [Corynebacterium camporealensis]|uniref:YihY/virulence factor BrkB family protein n=1 Tax=Corynebacterium camporealensis TaxID=161896 RepID=UPI0034CFF0E3